VVRRICSQGRAVIELEGGACVAFITRSLDAGRGESEVDLILYDEAYSLKESEVAALSPTQLASRNPQTIYLSSPVNEDMHANGYVLTGIRQRALDAIANGDTHTGLLYTEFGATSGALCSSQRRGAATCRLRHARRAVAAVR
jgi:hypothetical protein